MNSNQENKFSMYLLVLKVCKENNSVWNGLPAFVNAFDELENKVGGMKTAVTVQQTSVTGVTKDKTELRDIMIEAALTIAGAIIAFAENEENRTLQDKVSFTASELKKERDTIAEHNCQLIKDEAKVILADLADYGIEQVSLDELQTAIDDYHNAIPTPRQAIRTRRDATALLSQLIDEADIILTKKLDMLVGQFKVDNPVFYEAFKGARKIVNSGKRDTRLEGFLKDKATGEGIEGAIIELKNKANEVVDMVETGIEGEYVFEHLKVGIYRVLVEKEGYAMEGIEKADIRRGVVNR